MAMPASLRNRGCSAKAEVPFNDVDGVEECDTPCAKRTRFAQGSWTVLPDELQAAVLCTVGGDRLQDTVRLARVSKTLRNQSRVAVRQLLVDDNVDARMEALRATIAAAETGLPGATTLLVSRAGDDADDVVRKAALEALSYLVMKGDEEVPEVAAMAARLLGDPVAAVRRAALSLLRPLVERGDVMAVESSIAVAEHAASCDADDVAELRRDAMEAVAAFVLPGTSIVIEVITRCVSDACCEVRHEAILALGEVAARGDPDAVNLLCEHLVYPDVVTRRVTAAACAKIADRGDPRTVAALVRCSREDVDPSVRLFALDAIGVVAKPGDLSALEAASACLADGDALLKRSASRVIEILKGEPPSLS